MANQNSFQFGVEIELLLGSRKKTHPNWKSLARDLNKRLIKAGVANHINEDNDKSHENYREWSITQEITIPSQPAKNLWGLELVSPVYPIYTYWAADLEKIFSVLDSSFTLVPSPHCSTHIHISGTPVALSASELAALAKAALYYEPALDLLVPSTRRGSTAYWCQSNRANPILREIEAAGGLGDCLDYIDSVFIQASPPDGGSSPGSSSSGFSSGDGEGTRAVVEAMNLFPANSAYGRAHGKKKDFMRGKIYKWDFTGMLSSSSASGGGNRGTVEFRQPPGSLVAEDAAGWITLAVAFVVGAMSIGPRLGGGGEDVNGASPEELWELLAGGAEVLGWESLGAVEGLFSRMG